MDYNKIILMGRLTKDPELRYSPKGTAIAKFGLAVGRKWKTDSGEMKEETVFVEVDTFGRTAENVGQYMKKGSPIHIDGRLVLSVWDDKQSGQKRSKLGVVAESVQFLGGKRDGDSTAPATRQPATQPTAPKSDELAANQDAPEHDDVPF